LKAAADALDAEVAEARTWGSGGSDQFRTPCAPNTRVTRSESPFLPGLRHRKSSSTAASVLVSQRKDRRRDLRVHAYRLWLSRRRQFPSEGRPRVRLHEPNIGKVGMLKWRGPLATQLINDVRHRVAMTHYQNRTTLDAYTADQSRGVLRIVDYGNQAEALR
jgi:hypothetical protein